MPTLTADRVHAVLQAGGSTRHSATVKARFKPGQAVLARNIHPSGHTRLPRYVRGKLGIIDRDHGVFIFPDSHAATGETKPQHVYSVRFEATTLWGPQACKNSAVYVDLWDDYLQAATISR